MKKGMVLTMITSMLYPRTTVSRRVVSLSGIWKFRFDPAGKGKEENWSKGLKDAQLMPVPASFSDFFTDKDSREYTGDFWYQTDAFVPGEWQGNQIYLRFEAATHRATVFVNGKELLFHEGGFLPFQVDITDHVKYNCDNQIVVKLNNELSHVTLPAGETVILKNGRKFTKPYFDFFNYSGLQRDVKLVTMPKEAVVDFTVSHKIDGNLAYVSYDVITTGDHEVSLSVFDEESVPVAHAKGKTGTIEIKEAKLWNVLDPYLYRFEINILDDTQVIDSYYEEIGIRTVEIQGTELLINGTPVYLKGFGKHEDSDIVGRGFQMGVMKRDFELMKWIGANSFRTSHYPYSEEIYQMADREGFLIIDEVAAVGFFESLMNFMDASQGTKKSFFDHETIPELLQNHKNAITDLINRDKNHASVIAWSLFNEPDSTSEKALPYFEEIFKLAHDLDVQKRPRTFANIMMATPDKCRCYQLCDMMAFNRYYGWYVMGGYEMSDGGVAFRKELDEWKEIAGDKPWIITEYGADTYPGEHKLPSVMWSEEYQKEYLDTMHQIFDEYDNIKGEQVWNFADFQTTEGIMRVNGNKKGIFTRQRQPKETAWYFKKRWEALPQNHKSSSKKQ
jgi:beta-glucuronidase